jgi:hypothetical protein
MPNDPYDDFEKAIASNRKGTKGNRVLKRGYVGLVETVAKSAWNVINAPFRFPSDERMKKFINDRKRESEYWYERNDPDYLPPGHPDRKR